MTILLLGDLTGRSRVALRMLTYELEARGHEVLALPTALISNTLNLGQAAMLDTTDYLMQSLETWEKLGLTYVFITHDLTSITYLCDDVLFLYQGRVTEYLPVSRISETKDEYARRLLESIVVFDTETSEVAV